jgi:hypothetical protein
MRHAPDRLPLRRSEPGSPGQRLGAGGRCVTDVGKRVSALTAPEWDDDRLLEELRTAVRQAGSPTPSMTAAGYAAFSWGTVDAELAALTHDSDRDELVAVRGSTGPARTLVFTGTELTVELARNESNVVGQFIPPTSGDVTLLGPDGELATAVADELGCFDLQRPPRGPIRLRCRTGSGQLLTDWFRL